MGHLSGSPTQISVTLFLCTVVFCPTNSDFLGLCNQCLHLFSTTFAWVHSPYAAAHNMSAGRKLKQYRAYLICFPSQESQYCTTYCLISDKLIVVYGRKTNVVLVTPSCSQVSRRCFTNTSILSQVVMIAAFVEGYGTLKHRRFFSLAKS